MVLETGGAGGTVDVAGGAGLDVMMRKMDDAGLSGFVELSPGAGPAAWKLTPGGKDVYMIVLDGEV